MLKQLFFKLSEHYSNDNSLVEECWKEIEEHYTDKNRHYHNLDHLKFLTERLSEVKDNIQNWDVVLYAVFYHDIIYKASKSNNEEKSAEVAEKRLKELGLSSESIQKCSEMILATKSHVLSSDSDVNLFTDADLSILGQDWEQYTIYYTNVRKEFKLYPDLLYNPGRKKVLNHFLNMEKIFKTDYFYNTYERQARHNIKREMEVL